MNHQELYKIVQTVRTNVRCPQCGKQYSFKQIKIRGIVDNIVFLELNCTTHMPLLATIAFTPRVRSKKKTEKINSNDVVEVHSFLSTFSGNFEQVFKNGKK